METNTLFKDIADSLVIFNEITFNRLWELGADAYLLYSFYYKSAKFQKTNAPWATSEFAMKGLGWGKDRFKKAKTLLKDNGFIEDKRITDESGKVSKWTITLNYIQQTTLRNPPPPENHRVVQEPTNTSNYEDKILVTTNNNPPIVPLTEDKFEEFWGKYIPVHTNKGPKKTAREKFSRLTRTVNADEIILGTERYIADCHKNNCYTKNVVTFLNQEQWKDFLEEPKDESFHNTFPLVPQDYNPQMDINQVSSTVWAHVDPWWNENPTWAIRIKAITDTLNDGSVLNTHQKASQMALELAKEIFRYKDSPDVKNSLVDPLFWFSHRSVIDSVSVWMRRSGLFYLGYQLSRLVENA